LILFLAFNAAAQQTPAGASVGAPRGGDGKSQTAFPSDQMPASTSVRLGPGDLIELSVYNVPELSTKARVGNNGDVYLPLIDYVHVGDLTVEEAQELIEKRLAD